MSDVKNLFASVAIPLRVDTLKATNHIEIDAIPGMTVTSVHLTTLGKSQPSTD